MTLSRAFHNTVVSSHRTITISCDRHPPSGEQEGRGLAITSLSDAPGFAEKEALQIEKLFHKAHQ